MWISFCSTLYSSAGRRCCLDCRTSLNLLSYSTCNPFSIPNFEKVSRTITACPIISTSLLCFNKVWTAFTAVGRYSLRRPVNGKICNETIRYYTVKIIWKNYIIWTGMLRCIKAWLWKLLHSIIFAGLWCHMMIMWLKNGQGYVSQSWEWVYLVQTCNNNVWCDYGK